MCGIFGTINYKVDKPSLVLRSLEHRGPDEQNYEEGNPVSLFHTRLAIQELSPAGRQPMRRSGVQITFNGEIYNHQELRKKYQLEDSSRSDTLSLLLLYERLGLDMLPEMDGMFAFCIHDSTTQKVYLARDRAGKKPLYLWNSGDSYAFSSELNALQALVSPAINEEAIAGYLYLGYHLRAATPYAGIEELEGGTVTEIDLVTGQRRSWRWFDIAEYYQMPKCTDKVEALETLDQKLHTAVRRRIDSSDLEVGSFLSGGIDSGLITAIASGYTRDLKTFTVRMPGGYDESELAASVASRYRTRHQTIDISFDNLKDDLPSIIANYGEPFFDSSAIPSYYVAKAAKNHITVVLNGDGADELFGGYRRYVPFRYMDFFGSPKMVKSLFRALGKVMPPSNEKRGKYNYIHRLISFAGYKNLSDVYGSATMDLMGGFEDRFIARPDLSALEGLLGNIAQMPVSPLSRMLIADFDIILFSDLLVKMDIATMAHSLEGRSPFLSKDILEFAPTLTDQQKVSGTRTKTLLRDLAVKYLPADLINQPKRGFEIPLKDWMNGPLKEMAFDYLLGSSSALYSQFIRKDFVVDLWNGKVRVSDERRAKLLYALLSLEIWHKKVYLRKECA